MNKWLCILGFLMVISLFISGCTAQSVQAKPAGTDIAAAVQYQTVLGKSFNDRDVTTFFTNNNCSAVAQFEICKEAGMSFWMDSNQTVGYVYLYSGNEDGLQRYRGKLPYGLSFYDPMWLVQEKLKKFDADQTSPMAGLPDEAVSPDHIHYRASYKRLNLDVIYDTGSADPDAYIYAVLVSK
jgi:hypothetical protein